MRYAVLSVIVGLSLLGPALADDQTSGAPMAANAEPDGTVVFSGGSVAAGIGYTWGHGSLTYQGKTHSFDVAGLSVIDAAVSDISASGVVYNLKNLADLNGNSVADSAGRTLGR